MARKLPKTTKAMRTIAAQPIQNINLFSGWLTCLACARVCPLARYWRLLCLLLMDVVPPWLKSPAGWLYIAI